MAQIRNWFYISILSFLLSSAAVWFMPLVSFEQDEQKALAFVLAAVFWLGLIAGVTFQILVGRRRRGDINYTDARGIAFLRFFRNKPAIVSDISLIIGIITLALSFIINAYPQWLTTAAIFISVFSLEMHGVFSGRNYDYIYGTKRGYGVTLK